MLVGNPKLTVTITSYQADNILKFINILFTIRILKQFSNQNIEMIMITLVILVRLTMIILPKLTELRKDKWQNKNVKEVGKYTACLWLRYAPLVYMKIFTENLL